MFSILDMSNIEFAKKLILVDFKLKYTEIKILRIPTIIIREKNIEQDTTYQI